MEACGGAHYWGRRFEAEHMAVMLVPPQYVKPYRMGDKNDRNDTAAICEAAKRVGLKTVRVKTVEQQDLQMHLRVRESLIQRRTQVMNEARSFLLERGIVFAAGTAKLLTSMRTLMALDSAVSVEFAQYVERALQAIAALNEEIRVYDDKLKKISRTDPLCKPLLELAGIGPVTAVAVRAAIADPGDFKNGRQFSAFLGLVPRQNSTGGKTRLLGVAKDGNRYLRQLLIHGGRSVLTRAASKTDPMSLWAVKKWKDRGFNKACVAVANKNARMVWAIMRKNAQKQLAA
jgi:transposase